MHMQRALPQTFRHRREGGVDDGRIQRLHKEAEGDYPQLPANVAGKFSHLPGHRGSVFTRKAQPQAVKEQIDHRRGVQRQQLAHHQTADNGDPQRLAQL